MRTSLVGLAISLLLPACSTLPHALPLPKQSNPVRDQTIHVVSHGWHTGLIIPAPWAERSLPFLRKRFMQAKSYEFGWGDKGFYMANEITTGITLQALFWAKGSVVHVVALRDEPSKSFPHSDMSEVKLSVAEMDNLGRFLASSFQRDHEGRVNSLRTGIYGDSQFYEGIGRYHAMNTCNKWTAKGLRSAGVGLSTNFKLTSASVMATVKNESR
jgi:uncharacterized protein (TIGR02117 family)